MRAIDTIFRRHPLATFFILTFVLCWGLGAVLDGTILAPDGNFVSGVLIAALCVIALSQGRAGLADLGRRVVLWRVPRRWYGIVVALPVLIVGSTLVLLALFAGRPLDWTKQPPVLSIALLFGLLMILPIGAPVAEEIGWRGLALPQLLRKRSALTSSLVLGVIWSVWHLPVVLSTPELRVPVPFMLAVVPLSVLTTWIFLNTRASLFDAILFHAWFDVVLTVAFSMVAPADAALAWSLLAAVQTIFAVAVVLLLGPDLRRRTAPDLQPSPAALSST